ncbi:LuxR C-terminal-related transcriptional regulator [Kineococcus gynurae]|uniref:LuxR C-terminal-related transcriptional regulator n=1 Tax=Kineococcus gynurae TaxID=452979 RepID=A0ABV5LTE8_9ACTN
MSGRVDPDAVAAQVLRELPAGGDHLDVLRAAAAALRGRLGYDVAVWATVDPVTTMWTSCLLDGMARDPALEAAVFDNEYRADDVLKLSDLAAAGRSGTAWNATRGDVTTSVRHRDLLGPAGFDDELRVVLTDGVTPWGALLLLRGGTPFDAGETRTVDAMARGLATALRGGLLRGGSPAAPTGTVGPAGLVLCGPDGSVTAMTDEAADLLGRSRGTATVEAPGVRGLPQVLASVLASRRAGGPSTASAPTDDGRWLLFTATSLAGTEAVAVEQLPAHRWADLLVRGHGLTPRERDVLLLVAAGRTNRQVASQLGISDFTVGDHLKAVFAKMGVGSRGELVASLFQDAFAPLHRSDVC